jgi:hypothetical protein
VSAQGLENAVYAAVFNTLRPWYRFVPVEGDGIAWFHSARSP